VGGGDSEQRTALGDQAADVDDGLAAGRVGQGLHRDDLDDQVKGVQPVVRRVQQVRCVVLDGRVRVAAAGFTDRGTGDVEGGGVEAESGNVFSVGAQAAADHNRPPAMTVNTLRMSPPGQQ
jgi:hypothetical protein